MPEAITFIGPHPLEFMDRGDRMRDDLRPGEQRLSPLGFSVGRMKIHWSLSRRESAGHGRSWRGFAVPQSPGSVFTERFTMSEAQSRLAHGFSISDPETFTRAVSANGHTVWRWLPGAAIEPYECALLE
jgi:hypothetical protein